MYIWYVNLAQFNTVYKGKNCELIFLIDDILLRSTALFSLQVMAKARGELNVTAAGSTVLCEFKIWEDHWVQCAKELNQWDLLLEYANSKGM